MKALRSILNGCWQPTHKRPLFPYINWGLGNWTVGAGRLTHPIKSLDRRTLRAWLPMLRSELEQTRKE